MTDRAWIPRSTPFPNVLIDEVMPRLRDTEWRVLTAIVRTTLGWWDPGTKRRKRREWLSHQQLRRRTGRASAAISMAITNLVRSGLIEVTDSTGRHMPTSMLRRRSRSRLYYGIQPDLLRRLL